MNILDRQTDKQTQNKYLDTTSTCVLKQGVTEHWAVYYTSPQKFFIMLAYWLA